MSILKQNITVSNVNSLNGFFPVRTSSSDDSFDWEVAEGIVVRNLYNKVLAQNLHVKEDSASYEKFKDICRSDFSERLDDNGLWEYLDDMYFSKETFYHIAPECLLFKIARPLSSRKYRLGDLFSSMMQNYVNERPERMKRNFLEQQVVKSLRSENTLVDFDGSRYSNGIEEQPFLPFLTGFFRRDIGFLSNHPAYLIKNLKEFLKLYAYLYTAQLALNIDGLISEPTSRPLYFILENEIASLERSDLRLKGHQKVSENIRFIFPYLSMAETLVNIEPDGSRLPLWEIASQLKQSDTEVLRDYAKAFAKQRNLSTKFDNKSTDPVYWLRNLLRLSVKQFDKGATRAAAQGKFIRTTEIELCGAFVRNRGRAGKILVMNQDYLSLLTNLAVGNRDRLRFHELLEAFEARGVYFDKKSQQSLIGFYERIGNVERMSDSGDAVYVRKTI